ncbi:hypothetical protein AAY473_015114 [Plecturocebus cupreus]
MSHLARPWCAFLIPCSLGDYTFPKRIFSSPLLQLERGSAARPRPFSVGAFGIHRIHSSHTLLARTPNARCTG